MTRQLLSHGQGQHLTPAPHHHLVTTTITLLVQLLHVTGRIPLETCIIIHNRMPTNSTQQAQPSSIQQDHQNPYPVKTRTDGPFNVHDDTGTADQGVSEVRAQVVVKTWLVVDKALPFCTRHGHGGSLHSQPSHGRPPDRWHAYKQMHLLSILASTYWQGVVALLLRRILQRDG